MITSEMAYIKNQLSPLGRNEKVNFLVNSNLTDREVDLMTKRFVNGMSLKDCSDYFGIEINSISKSQLKAVKKLFRFLHK